MMIVWSEFESETSQHLNGTVLNSANSPEIHQMAQENTVWTTFERLVQVTNRGGEKQDSSEQRLAPDQVPVHANSSLAMVPRGMILSHARQEMLGNHQAVLLIRNMGLSIYHRLCMNGFLNVHFFSAEFFFFLLFNP